MKEQKIAEFDNGLRFTAITKEGSLQTLMIEVDGDGVCLPSEEVESLIGWLSQFSQARKVVETNRQLELPLEEDLKALKEKFSSRTARKSRPLNAEDPENPLEVGDGVVVEDLSKEE